jgi:hypothetical protein
LRKSEEIISKDCSSPTCAVVVLTAADTGILAAGVVEDAAIDARKIAAGGVFEAAEDAVPGAAGRVCLPAADAIKEIGGEADPPQFEYARIVEAGTTDKLRVIAPMRIGNRRLCKEIATKRTFSFLTKAVLLFRDENQTHFASDQGRSTPPPAQLREKPEGRPRCNRRGFQEEDGR